MEENLRNLKNILAANNYKLTFPRKLILQIFLDNKEEHLSAEEIYNKVREIDPAIGLSTIYRTLDVFCDLSIIQQLDFNDSCRRYELDNDNSHHHHLVCVECGLITEFNDHLLDKFESQLHKNYGFKTTEHIIKFYGYCNKCK